MPIFENVSGTRKATDLKLSANESSFNSLSKRVYVAKVHNLGAMGQNDDLLAKMPKIVVLWASPSRIFENRTFFRQNFSLGV